MARYRTYNPTAGEQDLPLGCQLFIPTLRPVGDVQTVPIIGRVYATGTPGQYQSTQARLTWTARGVVRTHALAVLASLLTQIESATRLYDGSRYLQVLRLADAAEPEEGFAGLKWTGTHTFDLADPFYFDTSGIRWRTPE